MAIGRTIGVACGALALLLAATTGRADPAPRPPWAEREILESLREPAWFWSRVSPHAADAHPGRWAEVLAHVAETRAAGEDLPDPTALSRRILERWWRLIAREAERRQVSIPLILSVIVVESAGNPRAISPRGAGGLMQLMPGTARSLGVRNSLAPAQNIRGGVRYLDLMLDRFGGDAVLALAAYNAGPLAVERWRGVPPYAETRGYVAAVAAVHERALAFCADADPGPRAACAARLR